MVGLGAVTARIGGSAAASGGGRVVLLVVRVRVSVVVVRSH